MKKNKQVVKIAKQIKELQDLKVHEPSYYASLCELVKTISDEQEGTEIKAISNTGEKRGGYPDIQIFRTDDGLSLGFIEVKLPGDDLSPEGRNKEQFDKYKEAIPNLIITDIINWQLWQWDEEDIAKLKLEGKWDFENKPNEYSYLGNLLRKFKDKQPISAETPDELAQLLARRDKCLVEAVKEVYESEGCPENLRALFNTIKDYLVKDIDVNEYVNMFAETITYSLFIARLQHFKNGEKEVFNLDSALGFLRHRLPKIPLLSELYDKATEDLLDKIKDAINIIVQDLRLCKIKSIYEIFTKHASDKDPIIYFYEPFLNYIDPEKKKIRGVFLTPKPIADFITNSVNQILTSDFQLEDGLANNNVHLLDPAIGTGTFMVSAIEQIYEDLKKKWAGQASAYIGRKMHKIIQEHIFERFYGFEVMMAPYAIAHLKLSILLEELGYNFDDGEKNKQFKILLTNTLENVPRQPSIFSQITKEAEAAFKVKNEEPVIVIIGNPPYANFGKMNVNKWISGLLLDYKRGLGEKKINLDDDYIKFIRFAQWKLSDPKIGASKGVFAMITNNSYTNGITHRQMRRSLMDTFDEIYIYNLHGNSRDGEATPTGEKDENVFDIQQGVSINIFVKYSEKRSETIVKYSDLWGGREHKFASLLGDKFETMKWLTLTPKTPYWFFGPKDMTVDDEYASNFSIKDIFNIKSVGIGTKVDRISVDFEKEKLIARVKEILHKKYSKADLISKFNLDPKTTWEYDRALKADFSEEKIIEYDYRPFDCRWIFYDKEFLSRSRSKVMDNFYNLLNIGLETGKTAFAVLCSTRISDEHFGGPKSYKFPLYLYDKVSSGKATKRPNISADFIRDIESKLYLKFIPNGKGDLEKTLGPESVFYYIYGVLHSPFYRKRYNDLLQREIPRIPITSNKNNFKNIVENGSYLVNLHLFGENPFSKTKITLLDNPALWCVKIDGNLKNRKVEKIGYVSENKRIYINKETYFEGIEKEVWEFQMGGYQVLSDWLKRRKGKELIDEEIDSYMKIVAILRETIKVMGEIDSYVNDVIYENIYINFTKASEKKKNWNEKEILWKSKSQEERRDIAQGFAVYKQGNPEMPSEEVEFIKRLMLLTKDPLSWLQNKQPA